MPTPRTLAVSTLAVVALVGAAWWQRADDGAAVPDGSDVVATVGDAAITTDELADAYAQYVFRVGLEGDDPAVREGILQSLINRRLLIQSALDDGLAETDGYRAARAFAESKALVDRYTAQEMATELAVTEADLRREFQMSHTTYAARHLYARSLDGARRLRARLLAGETFEALARETFADPTLAASGGSVGEFAHDDMDPAFEAAAFALPLGEVSEPVRTATGYSVIRVDARTTNTLVTEDAFNAKRSQLERYVRRQKRTEARFALGRRVLGETAPRFDEDVLGRLAAMAAGRGDVLDAEALSAWRATPILRFESAALGGVWTVGDVEARAETMTDRQRAAVRDEASLREFVEGLVVREEMAARARAAGLDRDPGVRLAVELQTADWVFAEAKRQLRTAAPVPDDTLRAHWAANTDLYTVPDRVRAREVLVATLAEAAAVRAEIEGGADFAAVARARSLRAGAAQASGDLGAVTRGQLGRVADAVFAARPGELVGPVEVEGRYAVIERGPALPPRPMTFEEAREDVAAELDVPFAQRRLAATLADLRRRYPVRIDRAAVERVVLFPTGPADRPARPVAASGPGSPGGPARRPSRS
jgi:parvulin-like peptidyl-prolyl isomerase